MLFLLICALELFVRASGVSVIAHPGVALLWVPTLLDAPARAPGGCVFEKRVGVDVHNARVSESTNDLRYMSRGRFDDF